MHEVFENGAHAEPLDVFLAVRSYHGRPAKFLQFLWRAAAIRPLQAPLGRRHVELQQLEETQEGVFASVQGEPTVTQEHPDAGGTLVGAVTQGEEDVRLHAVPDQEGTRGQGRQPGVSLVHVQGPPVKSTVAQIANGLGDQRAFRRVPEGPEMSLSGQSRRTRKLGGQTDTVVR